MSANPCFTPDAADLEILAAALRDRGWGTLAIAPGQALLAAAAAEVRGLFASGHLLPASTGRRDGRHPGGLRGDATLWLDHPACGEGARGLLAALDSLRGALNRRLMLGLDEVEAHYAHYPPGAGYARHLDRFRSDDARVLSLVLYLNADWPAGAGGELRLHLPDGARDIAPDQGTVVVFLSAEIEHEVLPATQPRFSVAAWFRQRPRAV